MKKLVFIILALLHLFSCSLMPNNSKDESYIDLEGTWISTYNRPNQIVVENGPTEFQQTSKLTIVGNQYKFEFDPPAPQTIFHFELLYEISGIYKISDSMIEFYDSTGIELKQELVYKIKNNILSITPPIQFDTTQNGMVIYIVQLGAVPWGYAMNIWEPFIKIE